MAEERRWIDLLNQNSKSCQITERPIMEKVQAFQKKELMARKKLLEKPIEIFSPLTGTILSLAELGDGAFSSGLLGRGVAIVPMIGKVTAPCDGKIDMIFDSGHAIGLVSDDGVSLLFHIGLETHPGNQAGISLSVREGERVFRGDTLLDFDVQAFKRAEAVAAIPVLVTNEEEYSAIYLHKEGAIRERELLITLQ